MVINEVKEAEKIIATNKYEKFSSAVALLVRYYMQIKGLDKDETIEIMKDFLKRNHQEYDYWEKSLNKMIKNSDKFPICQIDEIPITQKEMDIISQAGTEKKEKILFTFLVLGKLKWMRTGKAWVNDTGASAFRRANAVTRADARDYIIKEFYEAGYISYAKSPMNMSIHVDFIDEGGEAVHVVRDLRNLGCRWLQFKGQRCVECQECGIIFKPNSSNDKFCKEHRGYIPLVTKIVVCKDCGISFEAPSKHRTNICPACSKLRRKETQRKYRLKRQVKSDQI